MGLIFLDASVLIAVLDAEDVRHDRATAVLTAEYAEEEWMTSAVCAAEVLVGAYAAGDDAAAVAEDLLTNGVDRIEPVSYQLAKEAARLRAARRSITLADALHLATARALGSDAILTTDRAWRRVDARVRVL